MGSTIWPLIVDKTNLSNTENFLFATKDLSSDLNFLIGDLSVHFMKENFHTVIVNLAQSSGHYTHMLLKSGVNIKILRDSEKFSMVNFLSDVVAESNSVLPSEVSELEDKHCLKSLYSSIKIAIEKACTSKPEGFFLIIDEISVLMNLGISLQAIQPFVQYCVSLCSGVNGIKGNVLIGSFLDEFDPDNMKMKNYFCHLSDVSFHIESLKTGYSKDTHGKIIYQVKIDKNATTRCEKQFFKVGEKGVKLLTLGL